ncbi:cytochrome c-type biogenesis protein [Oceanibacterium hippocampi]|uniref:Cytochrome c-type biogenesis protein n=1 Tax=Oceanibacterium hippocampi TaxID=745714 RepID=A0A1Y5REW9_9PROT|nr:cytochrome c-type biogenesis protein [Oceanibacterium hippocampi]SLN14660.1 Cytochrome c-type biogenesis protein CcmH precursor [Oceanibacterium hippocampi]
MRRPFAFLAALFVVLGIATTAWGFGADEPLADPALEARAHELHRELRCLVCQNQSIADSNAGLARDLRILVRERIAAGDSDEQVRDYVVARYGDWVLLNPPFKLGTYLLWIGPFILLILGAVGVWIFLRRARVRYTAAAAPTPLSGEETEKLDRLLAEQDGGRAGE